MNLAALAAASRGDLANALIAAAPQPAAQAESAQGVPDGWRMVPVEPTPKMVDATWYDQVDVRGIIESHNTRNRRIYCAMIEAAPQPAAQPIGEIVVTKNEDGQIVAVTRQDVDGKILEVIATSIEFERQPMTVYQMMEYVPQGSADAGTVSGIVAAVEKFHGIGG